MQFSRAVAVAALLALQGQVHAVSSQKNAAAAVQASESQSPWLGLLTNSWKLAGEPEGEQTKGLDALANNIVKLAKDHEGAPDEAMLGAISSIREIVTSMKTSVNDTNAAAQLEVDKKGEAVAACQAPKSPELSLPITKEEVVTCRQEEKPLYDAFKLCGSEKARCSNTSACCASLVQPNRFCLNAGIAPSPLQFESTCDGTSKCKETDIKEKVAFFKGKLEELDAAEKACEDSRLGCQDSYDCLPPENAWKAKQTSCNTMQTSFEQGYCSNAETLEAAWDTYLTCYDTKKTALTAEEVKQEESLPGRQQEYRALMRIDCLLSALASEDVTSALEKCIDATYTIANYSHLVLRYPTRLEHFVSRQTCSEKLWAPGTEYFKSSMYAHVDSVLYPSSLNSYFCVSGLGSSHCPVNSGTTAFIAKAAVATKASQSAARAGHAQGNVARIPHHRHAHHQHA